MVAARVSLLFAVGMVLGAAGVATAEPVLPRPRQLSGPWLADVAEPAGSATVRLVYDDLRDPKPPAGVTVALVGYAADGGTTVVQRKTDARGVARFTRLDTTGLVAYVALAQLPRNRRADRLVSDPLVPDPAHGARVLLSAELRTARAAPVEERLPRDPAPPPPPPKGQVWVALEGPIEPDTAIELIDAATQKVVARGVAPDKELVLAVRARVGQVLYADAVSRARHYRSAPFAVVADRGARATIHVYPRLLVTYRFGAEADDAELRVTGDVTLTNYAWRPYGDGLPLVVPLPDGAVRAAIAAGGDDTVAITDGALTVIRPLPPGGRTVAVSFALPAVAGAIAWTQPLPFGSFGSQLYVDQEGVTLEAPPALTVGTHTGGAQTYYALHDITLMPRSTLALTLRLARRTKAEAALAEACRPLEPDRHSALRGKPAPAFTLRRPDGTPLALATLRGKPVLVNFMATWDALSAEQRPKLAALAKAVPDLQIVMVASDVDPAQVAATIGAGTPFRVVVDPPPAGAHIGRTTTAWGVSLLPESFLVDRKGVVRLYFGNARDWDSAAAIACVKAIAARR